MRMKGPVRKLELAGLPQSSSPAFEYEALRGAVKVQAEELVFVPYYFRANRGGRGHMRVAFEI